MVGCLCRLRPAILSATASPSLAQQEDAARQQLEEITKTANDRVKTVEQQLSEAHAQLQVLA